MGYEWIEAEKTEYYPEKTEPIEDGVIIERIGEPWEPMEEEEDYILGDPEKDDDNWHRQSEINSCAIACQEFVAEQILERDFSEQELIEYAEAQGWYHSAEGTSVTDVGKLLEAMGLNVERYENLQIKDLAQALSDGEKIICGVNSFVLYEPEIAEIPGIMANHAVQVIGIDYSDSENPKIILNDSGTPDGQGIYHDLECFIKAWETSNCYAVITNEEVAA